MNIGILQGRLSPSPARELQFFPSDWVAEFALAKEIGFSGIEWLIDKTEIGASPLLSHGGRISIGKTIAQYGLLVTSLHGVSATRAPLQTLLSLVDAASYTKERLLLMPLLEGDAPQTAQDEAALRAQLLPIVPALENLHVYLAFETEMSQKRLARFVDSFVSAWVGVQYDIGNCTSYGFDCPADIRALGHRIKGVHVKDRAVGSSQSVTLGTGDADIAGCVRALADIGWQGTLIMQAWRTPETYLQDARDQLAYLQNILREVENGKS